MAISEFRLIAEWPITPTVTRGREDVSTIFNFLLHWSMAGVMVFFFQVEAAIPYKKHELHFGEMLSLSLSHLWKSRAGEVGDVSRKTFQWEIK